MRFPRLLTLLLFLAAALALPAANPPPPTPASPETQAQLSEAFSRRLEQSRLQSQALTFDLFTPELDTAFTTPDGQTAVLWLALRDDDGAPAGRRARPGRWRTSPPAGWQVLLPGDPGWDETLAALPPGILPLEKSPAPAGAGRVPHHPRRRRPHRLLPALPRRHRPLAGRLHQPLPIHPRTGLPLLRLRVLPLRLRLHRRRSLPPAGLQGGQRWLPRATAAPTAAPLCTNYIVLFNETDQAYQIYLHLANGTIPDALTPGTAVAARPVSGRQRRHRLQHLAACPLHGHQQHLDGQRRLLLGPLHRHPLCRRGHQQRHPPHLLRGHAISTSMTGPPSAWAAWPTRATRPTTGTSRATSAPSPHRHPHPPGSPAPPSPPATTRSWMSPPTSATTSASPPCAWSPE